MTVLLVYLAIFCTTIFLHRCYTSRFLFDCELNRQAWAAEMRRYMGLGFCNLPARRRSRRRIGGKLIR
jgi:hypothetical protein